MGLIFSSTLQAEPCISPMCDCAIRLVAQWDLTVGDLRARNLWFRSSSRPFHISLEDLRHGESSSGLAVCSGTLLMPAPPSLPKAHLHMGPSVPWFGLGPMYASSVLGLILSLLWTPQVSLLPGEARDSEMGGWGLLPEETLCQDGSI